MLPKHLGQAGTFDIDTLVGGCRRRIHQNRDILFCRLGLAEMQGIGFNSLANRVEMVAARGHIRVPEFLGKSRVRTLAATHQADSATAQVGALGTLFRQRFDGHVPTAVCAAFFVKPDPEEHQGGHCQVRVEIDQHGAHIGFGKVRKPNIAIQKGTKLRPTHLPGYLATIHQEDS